MSALQSTLLLLSHTEGGKITSNTTFTPLQETLLVDYLRLLPKVAILADPTKSRSQMLEHLLTHVTKEAVQKSMAYYLPASFGGLDAVGGEMAASKTQALLCVHDGEGHFVCGCMLLFKFYSGSKDPSRTEIWNHLQNPQYWSDGRGDDYYTFLYLSAMEATREYFAKLNGTEGVAKMIAGVNPRPFPLQDFYDRLLVFGRSGFTVPSGQFTIVLASGTPVYETFENYAFTSRFYRDGAVVDTFVDRRTGTSFTLEDMRKTYPLLYPYWMDAKTLRAKSDVQQNPILLATNPLSDYDPMRIQKELARIGKAALPRPLSELYKAPVEQTYGFLSHSAYQRVPTENALEMFRLPADVEVLIFNSPGYSTHSEAVKQNWNATAKYFRHVPIQALKMMYPGFRETGKGHLSVDPLRFLDATSGGILTTVQHTNFLSKIQVHAYAGGDACPNLFHKCTMGSKTKDFVATLFGMFQFLNVPNYKDIMFKSAQKTYYADSDLMFGDMRRFHLLGSPDQRMRIYPTREDLEIQFFDDEEFVFEMTTSKIVDLLKSRVVSRGPKRLVLFSCGDLVMHTPEDVVVNETLKRIADLRKSYSVHLESDALYRRHIYRMGEGLFDLFGSLPAAFSMASMPALTETMRRGSRGSRGIRGSRGSRGSRGIRSNTRRGSRGSRKSQQRIRRGTQTRRSRIR